MLNYSTAPNQAMVDALRRYFEDGVCPGNFMTAILSNDLTEACGKADNTNSRLIFEWVSWLYNEAPSGAWGSPQAVADWIALKRPVSILNEVITDAR